MEKNNIAYIHWFAYYTLDSPSVRYRAKYPLDYAKEHGLADGELVIPSYRPKLLFRFLRCYFSALFSTKPNSIVVIQRVRSNFIYANLLKLLVLVRKEPTMYDIDDADYFEHDAKTIHFFAEHCNGISAGSEAIKEYLLQFNPNVAHITSPTPDLGRVKRKRNEHFTIGWIGGFRWGHNESLEELIFPAVHTLDIACRFVLLGINDPDDRAFIRSYFSDRPHIELVIPDQIDWTDEENIQSQICTFDVGVASLLDTPVHRAKSGIKVKQYMTCGVPALCNDLPENNKVLVDGYNGMLCNTPEAFERAILKFQEMTNEEYRSFSENARKSVADFNRKRYLEELSDLTAQIYRVPRTVKL